jgi:hypothetical protein
MMKKFIKYEVDKENKARVNTQQDQSLKQDLKRKIGIREFQKKNNEFGLFEN